VAKTTLTVRVRISGVRETLAAFRKLPKDASDTLRGAAKSISFAVARSARAAGQRTDAQSAAVSTTVKPVRDRVPAVQVGGSTRVGGSRTPAYRLLFGSEFGGNGRFGWYSAAKYDASVGRQFSAHTGREGRWFFPTIEREQARIDQKWGKAADDIIRRWTA
jgi:hypothetical protein